MQTTRVLPGPRGDSFDSSDPFKSTFSLCGLDFTTPKTSAPASFSAARPHWVALRTLLPASTCRCVLLRIGRCCFFLIADWLFYSSLLRKFRHGHRFCPMLATLHHSTGLFSHRARCYHHDANWGPFEMQRHAHRATEKEKQQHAEGAGPSQRGFTLSEPQTPGC